MPWISISSTFCEIVSAKEVTDWFSVSPTFPVVTSCNFSLALLLEEASENKTNAICFWALNCACPFAVLVAFEDLPLRGLEPIDINQKLPLSSKNFLTPCAVDQSVEFIKSLTDEEPGS